jgi:3-mercaptopropionate dioxygenase
MRRFRDFVQQMTRLVETSSEMEILDSGARLLGDLVAHDDWLPDQFAAASPHSYRQYLLHCDPLEHFSVVSFVWMPGQKTPIHNHTVWGLIGVMRGEEFCEEYSNSVARTGEHVLHAGLVDRVSPSIGDIHRVSNVGTCTAVSIHVYGTNIGGVRRQIFDPSTGQPTEFVSGYHNSTLPNVWN